MIKLRKKIRRKYSDFYTADDLFEVKGPPINLSIIDLDAKGHLVNPKAPCVVTTIDPKYTEDANRQQNFRKFNVKSDILRLREITRKKFLLYATQQRAIEKAREQEFQSMIYQHTKDFLDIASQQLTAIEDESFADMLAKNEQLKKLQCANISNEMKECVLTHQKLTMEVKDVHKRFIFLMKLIGYFDVNEDAMNILKLKKLTDAGDFEFLTNESLSDNITLDQIKYLQAFLDDVVKPYLKKQTYVNSDLWIAGYENTRRKLFDYYNQFTKLAILNHIVSIVHDKFIKSHNSRLLKPVVHKTPSYLKDRKSHLQVKATEALTLFENKQAKSKICWHIEGVAPVLLEKIQHTGHRDNKGDKTTAITQLEQIHAVLMGLLNELDNLEPDFCKHVEEEVRRRVAREKKASRKVLVKVNRFQNWIEHYKKH